MKRLTLLISLLAILLGLILSGISDSAISIADTNTPESELSSRVGESEDPGSASATVTITMFTVTDE